MAKDSVARPMPIIAERHVAWSRTRHASAGNFRVKRMRTTYLRQLGGQTRDEYEAYLERVSFLEATGRTREALSGLVFAKDAVIAVPAALPYLATDATGDGTPLIDFASHIVNEQLETGFGAIVVSHNGDPENPGTAAAPSGRPVLAYYPGEHVLAYEFGAVGGARRLTSLRLWEMLSEPDAEDEFARVDVEQVRVFDIDDLGVRERVFRKVETKKGAPVEWAQFGPEARPMRGGAALDEIPAVIVSATGKPEPGHIPLSPLAELNLSHYRTSADYEHALHFCGLPTPYATGVSTTRRRGDLAALQDVALGPGYEAMRSTAIEPEPALTLGSSQVIVLESDKAALRYLTLPVEGVGALREALSGKEAQMATLGASMLAQRAAQPESGEAISLRRSAETSGLVVLANSVSAALTRAIEIAALWQGADPTEAAIELNTDYDTRRIDPGLLTALVAAVNAGRMSPDTFVWNLKRYGMLEGGVTVDDELSRIEQSGPALGSIGLDQFGNAPFNDPYQNGQ